MGGRLLLRLQHKTPSKKCSMCPSTSSLSGSAWRVSRAVYRFSHAKGETEGREGYARSTLRVIVSAMAANQVDEFDSTTARGLWSLSLVPLWESWKNGPIVLMSRLRLRAVLLIYYLEVQFQSSSRWLLPLGDVVKGGFVLGWVGTLKKATQGNDWPVAHQARTLEVSGVLQKQGTMEPSTDTGGQPEVRKGA